jgi:colanic acid/amylovoran biosynthesis glycosyltransferase
MSYLKIAYLVSRYPAVSHTFIQREIQHLRLYGFSISVASINEPDIYPHQFLSIDEEEQKTTFYIKKQRKGKIFKDVLLTIFTRPFSFIKGLNLVFHLGGFNLKLLIYHFFYLIEAIVLGQWMLKLEIKHLHVHFANPAANVAMLLSKIYSMTYSMTVHGPDEFYDVTLNCLNEKIKRAQFIFCISNYTKSQLMRLSPSKTWGKLELVRLGIDPTIYLPTPKKESPSCFQILCVGRITSTKGQNILIDAVIQLLEQGAPIKLELIGDGPQRQCLEEKTKRHGFEKSIVFRGSLNSEATLEAYRKADIFALTSFAEGLPVVLMEAMAMEIPCIATAINGIPELIKNEINGLLISPSDIEETAQAILKLIQQEPLRIKIGQAARETILEKYNLQKNTHYLASQFEKNIKN